MITTSDQIRQAGEGKAISGLAAPYNQPADIGEFVETIRPGAFSRTLREQPDVLLLHSHNYAAVLGRTGVNLRLFETQRGLEFAADDLVTQLAFDALRDIRRQIIRGVSFGFIVVADDWTTDSNGKLQREIFDLDLDEVSIVSRPAYRQTYVQAGSQVQLFDPQRSSSADSRRHWLQQRDPQHKAIASRRTWIQLQQPQQSTPANRRRKLRRMELQRAG